MKDQSKQAQVAEAQAKSDGFFSTDKPQPSEGWLRMLRVLKWIAYNYNRMEVRGIENIPAKGQGGLICANHPGLLDPAYIHLSIYHERQRWCRWLGWAGLVHSRNKFIKWVVQNTGSMVPVKEHEGKAASKEEAKRTITLLIDQLIEGHLVAMFPEGINHKFQDYHKPYDFRTGAIRVAAKAGVPIIPTGLYGVHRVWPNFGEIKTDNFQMWITIPFWFPAKVKVIFGEPFYLPDALYEDPEDYDLVCEQRDLLKERIYALTETLY